MQNHTLCCSRYLIPALLVIVVLSAACAGSGSGSSGAASTVPIGPRTSFNGLSFQAPTAWAVDTPSSTMRVAQYRITPAPGDAEPGECALFHFPGQGGSVDANLQRWYGQFQQPDGGSTAERARVENLQANGLPVTLVEVSGTYTASMGGMGGGAAKPGYGMVAGVIVTSEGPWFLKCIGPEATMEAVAPGMRALLATVQQP